MQQLTSDMQQLTSGIPPRRSSKAVVTALVATAFGGAGAGLALAWILAPGSS